MRWIASSRFYTIPSRNSCHSFKGRVELRRVFLFKKYQISWYAFRKRRSSWVLDSWHFECLLYITVTYFSTNFVGETSPRREKIRMDVLFVTIIMAAEYLSCYLINLWSLTYPLRSRVASLPWESSTWSTGVLLRCQA